ncbi:GNAT family N-acetyltransferase [Methylobacterium goesingense]|uniref:RimJ/RimL family protein N-acetyltransferase n=1 Tax=Methylobacterium goesingense TaxID=243690 RepID=A0ABV2LBS6_9HYPH|nr:GNAT family N-acetyltransferase [Methylobacterium goesingense]GJD73630.1 hypothetical protein CFIICLFH_1859 [Methylobacterium goesingense]
MSVVPGLKTALDLTIRGQFSELLPRITRHLRQGFYREHLSFGLRRDIFIPFLTPRAKLSISVREIKDSDIPLLFPAAELTSDGREPDEVRWRKQVIATKLPSCFVAVDEGTGQPCYMQWLTGAAYNSQIQTLGSFPLLQSDEALLENAYTPSQYRGLGIMSAAMALIAERARDLGARYVITFVDQHNIASLKGCQRSGFSAHLIRRQREYVFGLFRTLQFEALPNGFLMPHEKSTGVQPLDNRT